MTAQELRQIGESIYGPQWQSPLACALGVSLRALQRWHNGQNPVPDGIAASLVILRDIAAMGHAARDARVVQTAAERNTNR